MAALPDPQELVGDGCVQVQEGFAELHPSRGTRRVQSLIQAALAQGLQQEARPVDRHDGQREVLLRILGEAVQREADLMTKSAPLVASHITAHPHLGFGAAQVEETEQTEHPCAAEVSARIVALQGAFDLGDRTAPVESFDVFRAKEK